MAQQKIKGFKGFSENMECRGFKFEENKIFKEDVEPSVCDRGFHFCELPLDVFKYYPPNGKNIFTEVEGCGNIAKNEDKTSTNKIKIKSKISIVQMFKSHFEIVFDKIETKKETTNTIGYGAHANTVGNRAHANTIGYGAHANTVGNDAHANTVGNRAHANTVGNRAHANTIGDDAHANTIGYGAHANTVGDDAIACSLGRKARAKALNGWIIIVDWRLGEDKYYINNIHSAKVGEAIAGVIVQPNVWYWFDNGELRSEA